MREEIKRYNKNGDLEIHFFYDEKERKQGLEKEYDSNGHIICENSYIDNHQFGVSKFYFRNIKIGLYTKNGIGLYTKNGIGLYTKKRDQLNGIQISII